MDSHSSLEKVKVFFQEIYQLWKKQARSDQDICALAILGWSFFYEGFTFAQGKNSPFLKDVTYLDFLNLSSKELQDFFTHFRVKKIPLGTLQLFKEQQDFFFIVEHIPSVVEMLDYQSNGQRPVTLIFNTERATLPVLNKKNGFHFFLHDLEHLARFHETPTTFRQQQRFFQLMKNAESSFSSRTEQSSHFDRGFDYLISDMNTHWGHSLSYLKAILCQEFSGQALLEKAESLAHAWTGHHVEQNAIVSFFNSPDQKVDNLSFLFE
jgi:hypothetical protein